MLALELAGALERCTTLPGPPSPASVTATEVANPGFWRMVRGRQGDDPRGRSIALGASVALVAKGLAQLSAEADSLEERLGDPQAVAAALPAGDGELRAALAEIRALDERLRAAARASDPSALE
jgi:hypothetical protein